MASSDPTNLRTTAVRDGDAWVLNGRKWCITGAEGAAFAIVVARTGDDRLHVTVHPRPTADQGERDLGQRGEVAGPDRAGDVHRR